MELERKSIDNIVENYLYRFYYYDEDSYSLKKKTIARKIIHVEGGGICETLTYFYCLFDRSYKITFGLCHVSPDGVRERVYLNHCWAENEKYVYDPTWGNKLYLKEEFYEKYQVQKGVRVYSCEEVTENLINYNDLGWSLEPYMLKKHDEKYLTFQKWMQRVCKNPQKVRYFYWHRGAWEGDSITVRFRFHLLPRKILI